MNLRFYYMIPERARGSRLWDADGKEYLDFSSQWGVTNTGNSHPRVVAAVREQVDKLLFSSHVTFPNIPTIELAERLISLTPGSFAKKVWFGLSGSDASEFVYKILPLWTGRRRFLTFLGSYHGSNMGGVTLSGYKSLTRFIGFGNAIKVSYPDEYRCTLCSGSCTMECLEYIEEQILPHYPLEDISSVVVEAVQSDAGEIVPPRDFLPKLSRICRTNGIKYVDDEIKVGFGRTGKMFAIEHFGVEPDVTVLGKSLGAGMPLSAVVGPQQMMDSTHAAHVFTLSGHPVSSAASMAAIDVIEEERLTENAAKVGRSMLRRLQGAEGKSEIVGDVRGLGLILGVELVKNKETKEPGVVETLSVAYRAWQLGLIVGVMGTRGNVLELMPPLNITPEEADKGIEILEESIEDVLKGRVDKDSVTHFAESQT